MTDIEKLRAKRDNALRLAERSEASAAGFGTGSRLHSHHFAKAAEWRAVAATLAEQIAYEEANV